MRVLVAPGSFGGALSAVQAATAIADGWSRRAPEDALTLAPVSDGGAGFVEVLHASLGGELLKISIPGLYGDPTSGSILVAEDRAYVGAADVIPATPKPGGVVERATSLGVGRLVAAAVATGCRRVVVGVPTDFPCNDGGAGLLVGLGALSEPVGALTDGLRGLERLAALDLSALDESSRGVTLVVATDDPTPLLGLLGTTSTAGARRGIRDERVSVVDGWLERFAALAGRRLALTRGAGAGGGVGFGLLVCGAAVAPGLATVVAEIGLVQQMARADLVVTGEAALDFSEGAGLTSAGVASAAASAVRPCIALAQNVVIGARETRALGIESAYGVRDMVPGGGTGDAAADLAILAERVARTWSRSRRAR